MRFNILLTDQNSITSAIWRQNNEYKLDVHKLWCICWGDTARLSRGVPEPKNALTIKFRGTPQHKNAEILGKSENELRNTNKLLDH